MEFSNNLMHARSLAPLRGGLRRGEAHGKAKREAASFSFGIEEEFFLADSVTGALATETPPALFEAAKRATDGLVEREFLQSQVEVTTPPYTSFRDAGTELSYVRNVLCRLASSYGLSVLACATHPTGQWQETVQSHKERYDRVMSELQMIGRRNLVCGMHVHVSVPEPDRRVEIMQGLTPYLPLLLALSTSSPFWQSRLTGLKGYRLAAYDELPRSGIPEAFESTRDYEAYVQALVRSGAAEDGSYVWWMVRPSAKYPTLELRAPDVCTRMDDALAIAALYRALVRHLYYKQPGARLTAIARALAVENKWRAQKHGVMGSFIFERKTIPVSEYLEEVIAKTRIDAEELDCATEVANCRDIVARGTSADIQVAIYEAARRSTGTEEALAAVTQWVAETTKLVASPERPNVPLDRLPRG